MKLHKIACCEIRSYKVSLMKNMKDDVHETKHIVLYHSVIIDGVG